MEKTYRATSNSKEGKKMKQINLESLIVSAMRDTKEPLSDVNPQDTDFLRTMRVLSDICKRIIDADVLYIDSDLGNVSWRK